MEYSEANKIWNIWRHWYWPCHFILGSIFFGSVPESYLPYPKEVLEEAINIIAKRYWDEGDKKMSDTIQDTMGSLLAYEKDEEALESLAKLSSNPEMRKAMLDFIANYKKDWLKWLEKKEKEDKWV
jgi:hypothetical protein